MASGHEMPMSFLGPRIAARDWVISCCVRGIDNVPSWTGAVYAQAYGGLSILFENEDRAIAIWWYDTAIGTVSKTTEQAIAFVIHRSHDLIFLAYSKSHVGSIRVQVAINQILIAPSPKCVSK